MVLSYATSHLLPFRLICVLCVARHTQTELYKPSRTCKCTKKTSLWRYSTASATWESKEPRRNHECSTKYCKVAHVIQQRRTASFLYSRYITETSTGKGDTRSCPVELLAECFGPCEHSAPQQPGDKTSNLTATFVELSFIYLLRPFSRITL